MPTITEKLLVKLDAIARFADGYFLFHAITPDKGERDALIRIKARNPEFFDATDCSGATLIRLTQSYCNFRRLGIILVQDHGNLEVAKRLIWGQFMVENSSYFPRPLKVFRAAIGRAILDDFTDEIGERVTKTDIVITDRSRLLFFKSRAIGYVPNSLRSVKARKVMCSLLGIPLSSEVPQVRVKENLIDSGFWPKTNGECHADERSYPLFGERISGVMKWKYDKQILKSGRIPEGYKFGVYSAEIGGQDGVI